MNRQDVLRGNRHHPQQADQQPFDMAAAAGFLAINQQQRLVRQGMGQAGLGNRHRESTEQRVGQSHRRATTQPTVEGLERSVDAPATRAPTIMAMTTCTRDRLSTSMVPTAAMTALIMVTSSKKTNNRHARTLAAIEDGCRRAGLKEVLLEGAHFAAAAAACQKTASLTDLN